MAADSISNFVLRLTDTQFSALSQAFSLEARTDDQRQKIFVELAEIVESVPTELSYRAHMAKLEVSRKRWSQIEAAARKLHGLLGPENDQSHPVWVRLAGPEIGQINNALAEITRKAKAYADRPNRRGRHASVQAELIATRIAGLFVELDGDVGVAAEGRVSTVVFVLHELLRLQSISGSTIRNTAKSVKSTIQKRDDNF